MKILSAPSTCSAPLPKWKICKAGVRYEGAIKSKDWTTGYIKTWRQGTLSLTELLKNCMAITAAKLSPEKWDETTISPSILARIHLLWSTPPPSPPRFIVTPFDIEFNFEPSTINSRDSAASQAHVSEEYSNPLLTCFTYQ